MEKTMVEQILGGVAGEVVTVKPNYIVLNDGQGHKAIDLVENGIVNKDKIKIIIDHNVPSGDSEAAAVKGKLARFSQEYKIDYLLAKGVAYQYMIDNCVKSGDIIVSCGKHNAIYGAVGALGLNVNIDVMAFLLTKGTMEMRVPQTVKVNVIGKLKEGASVMDAVITFLGDTVHENFEGRSIEFVGEGMKDMCQHDKEVILSMSTRTGAVTAFIPEKVSNERYASELTFDLSKVESVTATPCILYYYKPTYNYKTLKELGDVEINAAYLGGYTGGHIEDLRVAAKIMKGKHIAWGMRLCISPVTSKVYLQAMEEGLLETFIDFGAQIIAPGEHSIIKQGAGVIGHGEKAVTTGSYNYPGCMGCEDTEVYIASTETVVRAALTKKICVA